MLFLNTLCYSLLLGNNIYKHTKSPIMKMSPIELLEFSRNVKGPTNKDLYYSYNNLQSHLKDIDSVAILKNQDTALLYDDSGLHVYKYLTNTVSELIKTLENSKIDYQIFDIPDAQFGIPPFIQIVLGYVFISFLFNLFARNFNGGGMLPPGINKNKYQIEMNIDTTFDDVAGLPEAKEELEEIVDFLKNRIKYSMSGAKVPKGVLLEGPPGTGKTLLARAVAGEAEVSFLSASGSEFIEMFVGVGAQRVRKLFEEARDNRPCVIFIDEIDAIGGKRGSSFNSGGNDEREQTLNQILTNMDGFDKSDGIIVLAATNRADTLDPALKRSGRFDRKIAVGLPDKQDREDILNVHLKNKKFIGNVSTLATLTDGFSGADLQTLTNEAAILSVRNNLTEINDKLAYSAFEKMTIGLPKKYDRRTLETKKLVSYHEMGHAICVNYFSEYFNLQKITINANTKGAGGYTLFTPKNQFSEYPTKGFYLARIIVALGGRAAEKIFYQNDNKNIIFQNFSDVSITTGASGDLQQANELARNYIRLFENIPISTSNTNLISESTKSIEDQRVSEIINFAEEKAYKIINNNEEILIQKVDELIKKNTISI